MVLGARAAFAQQAQAPFDGGDLSVNIDAPPGVEFRRVQPLSEKVCDAPCRRTLIFSLLEQFNFSGENTGQSSSFTFSKPGEVVIHVKPGSRARRYAGIALFGGAAVSALIPTGVAFVRIANGATNLCADRDCPPRNSSPPSVQLFAICLGLAGILAGLGAISIYEGSTTYTVERP